MKLVFIRGLSKPLADRGKSLVSLKINELVAVINVELPKSKIYVKVDSSIPNKFIFIFFILPQKWSKSEESPKKILRFVYNYTEGLRSLDNCI